MTKRVRLLGVVTAVALVTGCSVINPHVTWTRPDTTSSGNPVTAAKTYARNAQGAYRAAMGDHATFTNAIGLGMIPLSAAALGVGATGASSEAVIALGLTSASLYAGGSFLGNNKPRARAYAAGIRAMTCAIEKLGPLDIRDTRWNDLTGGITTLNSHKSSVRVALRRLFSVYNELNNLTAYHPTLKDKIQTSLDSASSDYNQAKANRRAAEDAISLQQQRFDRALTDHLRISEQVRIKQREIDAVRASNDANKADKLAILEIELDAARKATQAAKQNVSTEEVKLRSFLRELENQNRNVQSTGTAASGAASDLATATAFADAAHKAKLELISAKALYDSANSTLTDSQSVFEQAYALRQNIGQAANELENAVDDLSGQVDGLIVETLGDLAALDAILSQLGQKAKALSDASAFAKDADDEPKLSGEKPAPDPAGDPLAQSGKKENMNQVIAETLRIQTLHKSLTMSVNALEASILPLELSKSEMAALVNAIDISGSGGAARNCTVVAKDIGLTVALKPAGPIEFTKGKLLTISRVISGGKSPYHASAVQSGILGLEVAPPFGSRVDVKISEDTPAGTYQLMVVDGLGADAVAEIIVTDPAAEGNGNTNEGNDGDGTVPKPAPKPIKTVVKEIVLANDRMAALQAALNMPLSEMSGTLDDKTHVAIKNFETAQGVEVKGILTDAVFKDIWKASHGGVTAYENQILKADNVKALQGKLGVTVDGAIGEQTRLKLIAKEKELGIAADGRIDKEVLEKLSLDAPDES